MRQKWAPLNPQNPFFGWWGGVVLLLTRAKKNHNFALWAYPFGDFWGPISTKNEGFRPYPAMAQKSVYLIRPKYYEYSKTEYSDSTFFINWSTSPPTHKHNYINPVMIRIFGNHMLNCLDTCETIPHSLLLGKVYFHFPIV